MCRAIDRRGLRLAIHEPDSKVWRASTSTRSDELFFELFDSAKQIAHLGRDLSLRAFIDNEARQLPWVLHNRARPVTGAGERFYLLFERLRTVSEALHQCVRAAMARSSASSLSCRSDDSISLPIADSTYTNRVPSWDLMAVRFISR